MATHLMKPGHGPGWTSYEPAEHEVFADRVSYSVNQFVTDCREFAHIARYVKLDNLHTRFGLSWEEFCTKRLRQSVDVVEAILVGIDVLGEEVPVPAEMAEKVGRHFLSRHDHIQLVAAPQTTGDILPEGNSSTRQFVELKQGERARQNGIGVVTQRKLDRLARDYPALHACVISGELSTHAAAKAAGIVKDRTSLQELRRHWKKASQDERAAFLAEIREEA